MENIINFIKDGDWVKTEQGYLYEIHINPNYKNGITQNDKKKFRIQVGKEKFWYIGFILTYGIALFHETPTGYEKYYEKKNGEWTYDI